jgi:hypothetical protein
MAAEHIPCEYCGEDFIPRSSRAKYCTKICGRRAYSKRRLADGRHEALRKSMRERMPDQLRQWSTESSRRTRARDRVEAVCAWCKEVFDRPAEYKDQKYCSKACNGRASRRPRPLVATAPRRTGPQQKTPLRIAVEGEDLVALRPLLLERATVVGDCWLWPRRNSDGYASTRVAGEQLYRAVTRVAHGLKPGEQAHHKCANRSCVNPDHLQPVSSLENTAEMFQRNFYLKRIEDLERALRQAAPSHPLLSP